jgi:hypothetical protein
LLPTESIDFDTAAAIYRSCRSQGKTIKAHRRLIAAVAMRKRPDPPHGPRLLAIAAATDLRIDDA